MSFEKELCKFCIFCCGLNEDVFWILFMDKRKVIVLKIFNGVENGDDFVKVGERRKLNDKIFE